MVNVIIQDLLTSYTQDRPPGAAVVIFPKVRNANVGGTHDAVIVVKTAEGDTTVRSRDWVGVVIATARSGETTGLSIEDLTFTYGETQQLSSITTPPAPRTTYVPSTPRNGCVSNTSAYGSSMSCYTNGRLTYRNTCTVDSRGNIACRSDSY